MTTHPINEDTVEQATITWLNELGYAHRYGPDIADDLSSKKIEVFTTTNDTQEKLELKCKDLFSALRRSFG